MISPCGVGKRFTQRLINGSGVGSLNLSTNLLGGETLQSLLKHDKFEEGLGDDLLMQLLQDIV